MILLIIQVVSCSRVPNVDVEFQLPTFGFENLQQVVLSEILDVPAGPSVLAPWDDPSANLLCLCATPHNGVPRRLTASIL